MIRPEILKLIEDSKDPSNFVREAGYYSHYSYRHKELKLWIGAQGELRTTFRTGFFRRECFEYLETTKEETEALKEASNSLELVHEEQKHKTKLSSSSTTLKNLFRRA